MFVASLNFADDYGNLDRSAKQLKVQTMPYDDGNGEAIVNELLSLGLFIEYQVDGKFYLHIKNFEVHQRVDHPSKSRLPLYDLSLRTQIQEQESSRVLTEGSRSKGLEGKGMEGNGREGNTTAALRPIEPTEFLDLKAIYPPRAGSNPWNRALKACRARLAEGISWETMTDGTRRYQRYCHDTGKLNTEFVLQAATFFGPDHRFLSTWDLPSNKAETLRDANIEASRDWLNAPN
jgi:hypothetical protein